MRPLAISAESKCVLRPARQEDCWALQRFVLALIWTEALGFDLRILTLRIVTVLALAAIAGLQIWLFKQSPDPAIQSIFAVTLFCTALVAIGSIGTVLLYILLIPLEPLINWSMYRVAECDGSPVGCGALAGYKDFCVLYHLFVQPARRRQSLASNLVRQLLEESHLPVYLVCKPKMVPFYTRLGFTLANWTQLPSNVRRHFKDFERDRDFQFVRWEIMSSSHQAIISSNRPR